MGSTVGARPDTVGASASSSSWNFGKELWRRPETHHPLLWIPGHCHTCDRVAHLSTNLHLRPEVKVLFLMKRFWEQENISKKRKVTARVTKARLGLHGTLTRGQLRAAWDSHRWNTWKGTCSIFVLYLSTLSWSLWRDQHSHCYQGSNTQNSSLCKSGWDEDGVKQPPLLEPCF